MPPEPAGKDACPAQSTRVRLVRGLASGSRGQGFPRSDPARFMFSHSDTVLDVLLMRHYIRPVHSLSMPRFYDFLPAALGEGQPFALGIISGIKGSSPQKKGAKALFYADGRIQGTLGGDSGPRATGLVDANARHLRVGVGPRLRMGRRADLRRQGLWLDSAQCRAGGGYLAKAGTLRSAAGVGCPEGFFLRLGERVRHRRRLAVSGNGFTALCLVDRRFRARRPGCCAARVATGFRSHGVRRPPDPGELTILSCGNTLSSRLLGDAVARAAFSATDFRPHRHAWPSTRRARAARLGKSSVCFSRADW